MRIPREFEFDAQEVIIRREGDRLMLEPVPRPGLLETLARLRPLADLDFADWDEGLTNLDDVSL